MGNVKRGISARGRRGTKKVKNRWICQRYFVTRCHPNTQFCQNTCPGVGFRESLSQAGDMGSIPTSNHYNDFKKKFLDLLLGNL